MIEGVDKLDNDLFWRKLRKKLNKIHPFEIDCRFDLLLASIKDKKFDINDFHPVMTLRTLITNLYNPIRMFKFVDLVKEYFPQFYYSNSSVKKLLDHLSESLAYDSVFIQITAYFIIYSFLNTPNPINRQDFISNELLFETIDEIIFTLNECIINNLYTSNV